MKDFPMIGKNVRVVGKKQETPRLPDAGQWFPKFSPAEPLASVQAVYRLSPGRIMPEIAFRSPSSGGSAPQAKANGAARPRCSSAAVSINHNVAKAADSRPSLSPVFSVRTINLSQTVTARTQMLPGYNRDFRPDSGIFRLALSGSGLMKGIEAFVANNDT